MLLLMVNKLTGSLFCTPELTGRAYMNQTTRVYCQRVAESCGICFGADRRGGRWRRRWRSGRGWCGDGVFSTSSAPYHSRSNQLAIRIYPAIGTSPRTFYGPIWPKYPSWAQGCSSVRARRRFSSKQQQQQQKTIFWYLDTTISKIGSFGVS